jgi:hypothetical protein
MALTFTEDFESYTVGETAADMGWEDVWSSDILDTWTATTPSGTGNSSDISFSHAYDGTQGPIRKQFTTFGDGFSDTDTVTYSISVLPTVSGNAVQALQIGVSSNGKDTNLFGVSATSGTSFYFYIGTTQSTDLFDAGDWYDLQFVVDQSDGATEATGSLYVMNTTDGETTYTAVDGLQDIALDLTESTKVSTWNAWYIRTTYTQEIDNLSLTNSSSIPELSSSSLLLGAFALSCVCVGSRRRNR